MSKQAKQADASEQSPDFESALAELEQLVEALESGELSLADSLDRFTRGVALSKRCHQLLDEARQSVEILTEAEDPDSARHFDEGER